jgi:hypothetical protein
MTNGSFAMVCATAIDFTAASRSTSARASAQMSATAITASTTITASCRANSLAAMLHPRTHRTMSTSQRRRLVTPYGGRGGLRPVVPRTV